MSLKETAKTEDRHSINGIQDAFSFLTEILMDGLRHGFFEFTIACAIGKHGNREFIIKAGKSYKFIIPENDIWKEIQPDR